MPYRRSLKFLEAYDIPHWQHLTERKYKNPLCTKAATAYTANLMRAHMLTRTPGISFRYGKIYRTAQFKLWEDRGNFDPLNMEDEATFRRTWELFAEVGSSESPEQATGNDIDSTKRFEQICATNERMYELLETILQSVVIQAWTAFEVLAEDLWTRVLRLRPKLETRTKDEKRWSGPRSRMKIANLYRFTFRADNAAIMRAVNGHRVHALAMARNVLVHNGGFIDKSFISDRKPVGPKGEKQRGGKYLKAIRGRRIGYKIRFTGPLVRSLVDPVTPLGFDLVRAVDRWLVIH